MVANGVSAGTSGQPFKIIRRNPQSLSGQSFVCPGSADDAGDGLEFASRGACGPHGLDLGPFRIHVVIADRPLSAGLVGLVYPVTDKAGLRIKIHADKCQGLVTDPERGQLGAEELRPRTQDLS